MALPLTQLESSVDPHCRGQHKPAARRPGWLWPRLFAHLERDQKFLVSGCNTCGKSFEWEGHRPDRLIMEDAAQIGYCTLRRVVEVEGTCSSCTAGNGA